MRPGRGNPLWITVRPWQEWGLKGVILHTPPRVKTFAK